MADHLIEISRCGEIEGILHFQDIPVEQIEQLATEYFQISPTADIEEFESWLLRRDIKVERRWTKCLEIFRSGKIMVYD